MREDGHDADLDMRGGGGRVGRWPGNPKFEVCKVCNILLCLRDTQVDMLYGPFGVRYFILSSLMETIWC